MTLLNYNCCMDCIKIKNDVKVTLHHLLPVNICNMICDYNIHCEYCDAMLITEDYYIQCHQDEEASKIEMQIRMFQFSQQENYFPRREVKKIKVKKMNALIDDNGDDDMMYKKLMKCYFNGMYRYFIRDFFPALGHKKKLIAETKHIKGELFPYYKYRYREDLIVKMIIYEYLLGLIGKDLKYIELEDIHNYLDEIFPK